MAFVQYHHKPELRNPVLIAAFAGWNDAADAATTSVKFLIDRWKAVKIAEIEAEEFYVFTETRPTVHVSKGLQRSMSWPSNQFLSYAAPHFLANILHSMDVPISGFSSNAEMLERLQEIDVQGSRYEGPTGIPGVLHDTFSRAKIPVSSLWAAAPHYLAATPNIKVTAALLTYLNTFLSFDLELGDIQADALRFEEQITMLVARDPEASAYVRKLEQQAEGILDEDEDEDEDDEDGIIINPDEPVSTGPLPSADTLIRSVEELLRKERENNQNQSDDVEDDE